MVFQEGSCNQVRTAWCVANLSVPERLNRFHSWLLNQIGDLTHSFEEVDLGKPNTISSEILVLDNCEPDSIWLSSDLPAYNLLCIPQLPETIDESWSDDKERLRSPEGNDNLSTYKSNTSRTSATA